MGRRPVGGKGSNQYQTKPRDPGPRSGAEGSCPEDVAWVFHPDHDAWVQCGFGTMTQAAPWIAAGFAPRDAQTWFFHVGDSAADAQAWVEAGFLNPFLAWQWNEAGVTPTDAVDWIAEGFAVEAAAGLRETGFKTAGPAAAAWAAHGFTVEQRTDARWFPDPAECRRWTDWINEHYNRNDRGRGSVWRHAHRQTTEAGTGYDFDTIAKSVLSTVNPGAAG